MKHFKMILCIGVLVSININVQAQHFEMKKRQSEGLFENYLPQKDWKSIEDLILVSGANPNVKSVRANPLLAAIFDGNQNMVHFLIQHGADLNQKLDKDYPEAPGTVWEYILAQELNQYDPEMFSLLKHYKNVNMINKNRKSLYR